MIRVALALFMAATAVTSEMGEAIAAMRPSIGADALAEGGYVLPPVSFTKFCLQYPAECAGVAASVHLDAERMRTLEQVNVQVNRAIAPRNLKPYHDWTLDTPEGDCNDYAVQKRHELIARGWPAGALALSVVRTPWGEGHLVVTVRTDAGDYVLDNLRADVVDWRRSHYRWVMRQSARNPQFWVALNGGRPARSAPASEPQIAAASPDANAAAAEPAAEAASPASNPGVAPPAGARSGRAMTLSLADGPQGAEPTASMASLRLAPSASLEPLALSALPYSATDAWASDDLAMASSAETGAWELRGAIDETPPA